MDNATQTRAMMQRKREYPMFEISIFYFAKNDVALSHPEIRDTVSSAVLPEMRYIPGRR